MQQNFSAPTSVAHIKNTQSLNTLFLLVSLMAALQSFPVIKIYNSLIEYPIKIEEPWWLIFINKDPAPSKKGEKWKSYFIKYVVYGLYLSSLTPNMQIKYTPKQRPKEFAIFCVNFQVLSSWNQIYDDTLLDYEAAIFL